MAISLDDVLDRYRADLRCVFSAEEVACLVGAADEVLDAARALADHAARVGDPVLKLEMYRRVAAAEPSSNNLCNVVVALRALGRDAEAREFLLAHRDAVEPIAFLDLMCSLCARLGLAEDARAYGTEALVQKDAQAPPAPPLTPTIHAYDCNAPGRNVIAFSLFGAEERYVRGAIANAQIVPFLYAGWTARFYVDGSVPESVLRALAGFGAQLARVEGLAAERYGTFWRFLVEDDPGVAIYLVRDCDSVVNIKERAAVAEWLGSGTAFHAMRDSLQHSELMLAGMWGAHRGNIGGMDARIRAFHASLATRRTPKTLDQHFLRRVVWPIARQSLTHHDRYFDFMAPRRFNPDFAMPDKMGIGQNLFGG